MGERGCFGVGLEVYWDLEGGGSHILGICITHYTLLRQTFYLLNNFLTQASKVHHRPPTGYSLTTRLAAFRSQPQLQR